MTPRTTLLIVISAAILYCLFLSLNANGAEISETQAHRSLTQDTTCTLFAYLYPYYTCLGYWSRDGGSGYTESYCCYRTDTGERFSLHHVHLWTREGGLRDWWQVDSANGKLLIGGVR